MGSTRGAEKHRIVATNPQPSNVDFASSHAPLGAPDFNNSWLSASMALPGENGLLARQLPTEQSARDEEIDQIDVP